MSAFLKSKKGKIISAAVLIAAVIAILALFLIPDKEKGYRSIRISELSGTVMTENDSGKFAAYENMYLGDGIILSTDSDSYTRMILDSDKYVL